MQKITRVITLSILILTLAFASSAQEQDQNDFEISKNIDVFITLYKQLNTNYVDNINPGQLVKTAIDAMLKSLDPYTVYIPEADIEDYKFMTTGQYGGIGALIHKRGDYVYISEPYENSPADKAGLKTGDKILEINGKSVKKKTVDEVSTALKGQPGTSVTILIERDSTQKPIEKEIIRQEIKIDNVPYSGFVADKIGYINLSEFKQNAAKDVKEAFNKLNESKDLKGVIIDLRGNGGGLLNEAVSIVNIFVDKGQVVVSTIGKIKNKNHIHKTQTTAVDTKIPLVILVDEYSASASEILAGAIQDLDRGIIIGQRTFGKGLVQNIIPLSYNSEMKITIAKYYIPSGRCVQALDYFNKDTEGRAPVLPDSLRKTFKTKNGRTVYEGSGIEPDILMDVPELSNITITLINKNHLFDFALTYYRNHPEISPPAEFNISDKEYSDFIDYLTDKDYSYTTESEARLEEFKNISTEEKYFESIKDQYQILKDKIIAEKSNDLMTYKQEIIRALKMYIVPLYYYQKGRIQASLDDDNEVKKAIEILNNPEKYQKILQGPK
ncbi:MAG: S41 family peptidase [Bacteroidales bacterium]|jgi:carboxyl-terminal processing protease|nr:S41 family peptidase [Bacteroidales bacterium]